MGFLYGRKADDAREMGIAASRGVCEISHKEAAAWTMSTFPPMHEHEFEENSILTLCSSIAVYHWTALIPGISSGVFFNDDSESCWGETGERDQLLHSPQVLLCHSSGQHSGLWAPATCLTISYGHPCSKKNKQANIHMEVIAWRRWTLALSMAHSWSQPWTEAVATGRTHFLGIQLADVTFTAELATGTNLFILLVTSYLNQDSDNLLVSLLVFRLAGVKWIV